MNYFKMNLHTLKREQKELMSTLEVLPLMKVVGRYAIVINKFCTEALYFRTSVILSYK